MNPVLTANLLQPGKSIENNALAPADGLSTELGSDLLEGDFSDVLGDMLSADGKIKPLDLAALKEFGIQDLSDLQELVNTGLPTQSLDLKQISALNLLLSPELEKQIENVELFGNPDVNTLLKSNLVSDDLLHEGLTKNKSDLLAGKAIATDALQQSLLKKESDLSNMFGEMNLSKYIKEIGNRDLDFGSELLAQTGKQEINNIKLVDQLSAMDKPLNPVTSLNSHSVKSYTSLEQSGAALNRIEVPVTKPGWGEAVGNRLMMMVSGKMQTANIHLNPAELGPIEIRVSVNNEHASVHFVSNNSVVREAIEDAFPRLKEMFTQNGLTLSDANVSQNASHQHGNASSDENAAVTEVSDQDVLEADTLNETKNESEDKHLSLTLVDQYV